MDERDLELLLDDAADIIVLLHDRFRHRIPFEEERLITEVVRRLREALE